ncbi:hypothetical protein QBC41DRAFT_142642 [Cercophora samala]|uniref:Uncharacterized protein n=1 Tax=Cercophora samala TaxID=330535 RepID=A0AA39ZAW7_9PEZI|nr:hypothetical protein QBC41DRAFT_142642 [Cercophora samala]
MREIIIVSFADASCCNFFLLVSSQDAGGVGRSERSLSTTAWCAGLAACPAFPFVQGPSFSGRRSSNGPISALHDPKTTRTEPVRIVSPAFAWSASRCQLSFSSSPRQSFPATISRLRQPVSSWPRDPAIQGRSRSTLSAACCTYGTCHYYHTARTAHPPRVWFDRLITPIHWLSFAGVTRSSRPCLRTTIETQHFQPSQARGTVKSDLRNHIIMR